MVTGNFPPPGTPPPLRGSVAAPPLRGVPGPSRSASLLFFSLEARAAFSLAFLSSSCLAFLTCSSSVFSRSFTFFMPSSRCTLSVRSSSSRNCTWRRMAARASLVSSSSPRIIVFAEPIDPNDRREAAVGRRDDMLLPGSERRCAECREGGTDPVSPNMPPRADSGVPMRWSLRRWSHSASSGAEFRAEFIVRTRGPPRVERGVGVPPRVGSRISIAGDDAKGFDPKCFRNCS
mmetsp:Transcript_46736/g.111275  ORF Transcript_46736/g.111275 Transcript_46736/m.111275 type:complete len:233 (-) Transcript_46736:244-942(-)